VGSLGRRELRVDSEIYGDTSSVNDMLKGQSFFKVLPVASS